MSIKSDAIELIALRNEKKSLLETVRNMNRRINALSDNIMCFLEEKGQPDAVFQDVLFTVAVKPKKLVKKQSEKFSDMRRILDESDFADTDVLFTEIQSCLQGETLETKRLLIKKKRAQKKK
jgi:hypothetical protein